MNLKTDLAEIAQLIETCFATTLDAEGIGFVQYLRKISESQRRGTLDKEAYPNMSGFVWQDKGKVVANCSLIPHVHQGTTTYLIANVTVLEPYRKNGIAKELTRASIEWLRRKHQSQVWLQVREGNDIAYHLYQELGFLEKYHRNTWLIEPRNPAPGDTPQWIRPRRYADWNKQNEWLDQIYPEDIRWCLGLNSRDLAPSLINMMTHWMDDRGMEHFCCQREGQLVAVCSWQPSTRICPPLWLASEEAYDAMAVQELVPSVVGNLRLLKPVQINFPHPRSNAAFLEAGHKLLHSLKWMKLVMD